MELGGARPSARRAPVGLGKERAPRTFYGTLSETAERDDLGGESVPTRKTAFDRYVDEQKKSPTFAAEYERVGAEVRAVDDLIRLIDAERVDLGMSKADLARKVSTTPAAMRRLLTSGEANPTITTVLDVLAAVGMRLTLLPSSTSKPVRKREGDAKPQHRKTA
jgi:DNA-binding phage protein